MRSGKALILSALLAAATGASAAEYGRESPRDKAVMLYFSKSFGGTKSHAPAPLAFGLRLQQSSPFEPARAVALIDARHWLGGRGALAFGGVPVLSLGEDGSSGQSSDASASVGREHPGWTAAMIVVAVLGGMCLAEWGICEDDDPEYSGTESPGPSPGTG
jgi:hypothetical protein